VSRWTPDEGEIIWIQLDPQVGREQLGREQAGHRPAIVLTPADYNRKSGLLLCVPLTTRIKGYPFEVAIAGEPPSVALVDHVKSLDWSRRRAKPKGRVDPTELEEVRQTLRALIG
jgi:mRNA interferase MazF